MGALGFCGCAVVGPQSITAGRGVYAEVINRTEDEQILNVIVRQRYDETFGMISVASVTANLSFSAQAGTNVGNLVPLSAGVAYEENPTMSYVPLSGEDFMRRMLSPVSTSEWLLIGGPAKHPGYVFALAVRRVNGLRNPLLGEEPPSPEFARFVEPVTWAVPEEERFITIRSSERRPDDATVRIRFRDRWFYIDATDTRSKRAFLFLRTFIGMRLADPGAAQQAPVLTVPVN